MAWSSLEAAKLQQNNIAAIPRPENIKQGFALGGYGKGKQSYFDRSRKDQSNRDRRFSLRNDFPVRYDELRTKRNVPIMEQRRQHQQDVIVDEEKKKENRDKTKRGSEIFDLGNKSCSSDKNHRNSADSNTKLGITEVNNGVNPIYTPGHSLTDDSWKSHIDSDKAPKESSSLGNHPTSFYYGTKTLKAPPAKKKSIRTAVNADMVETISGPEKRPTDISKEEKFFLDNLPEEVKQMFRQICL